MQNCDRWKNSDAANNTMKHYSFPTPQLCCTNGKTTDSRETVCMRLITKQNGLAFHLHVFTVQPTRQVKNTQTICMQQTYNKVQTTMTASYDVQAAVHKVTSRQAVCAQQAKKVNCSYLAIAPHACAAIKAIDQEQTDNLCAANKAIECRDDPDIRFNIAAFLCNPPRCN